MAKLILEPIVKRAVSEMPSLFRLTPYHHNKKPPEGGSLYLSEIVREIGAGEGIRTLDPNLGKVVLYP
jgi:hypothetical protein